MIFTRAGINDAVSPDRTHQIKSCVFDFVSQVQVVTHVLYGLWWWILLFIKLRLNKCRLLIAFLVFLILTFSGLGVFLYQFINDTNSRIDSSIHKAVNLMDEVFSFAESASIQVLEEADGRCDAELLMLREKVALIPFVRTITLVNKNGLFYCSSLFGDVLHDGVHLNSADYSHGQLSLLPGNDFRLNHPVVVYKRGSAKSTALVSIDGDYIRFILNVSRNNVPLEFKIGKKSYNNNGVYITGSRVSGFFSLHSSSQKYPYYVSSDIYVADAIAMFRGKYEALVYLLVLISAIVSALTSKVLKGVLSYKEQMRIALYNGEFIPYFQPIVESSSNKVIGVEILMRWHHPKEGILSPDEFIPHAESSGLIVEMTRQMMLNVASIIQKNQDLFPDGFHIAFNVTAEHLQLESLIYDCRCFQKMCGENKISLMLELTERNVLNYSKSVISRLEELSLMGVELALDDFGTGHSSLITLQTFNFNCIKIDKAFVSGISDSPDSRYIVEGIISLAKKLKLLIVAEGIETLYQEEYLKISDVDYLQGYLYSRPIDTISFLKYMEEQGINA